MPGPVAVVICGTNGTGKSTIASLLASRLGVPHVLATDAVRHMLATLAGDPVLQASTYEVHRALTFPEVNGGHRCINDCPRWRGGREAWLERVGWKIPAQGSPIKCRLARRVRFACSCRLGLRRCVGASDAYASAPAGAAACRPWPSFELGRLCAPRRGPPTRSASCEATRRRARSSCRALWAPCDVSLPGTRASWWKGSTSDPGPCWR